MKKFNIRKVLDGLKEVSSSAPSVQVGPQENHLVQETIQSEHFQLCKVSQPALHPLFLLILLFFFFSIPLNQSCHRPPPPISSSSILQSTPGSSHPRINAVCLISVSTVRSTCWLQSWTFTSNILIYGVNIDVYKYIHSEGWGNWSLGLRPSVSSVTHAHVSKVTRTFLKIITF